MTSEDNLDILERDIYLQVVMRQDNIKVLKAEIRALRDEVVALRKHWHTGDGKTHVPRELRSTGQAFTAREDHKIVLKKK